MNHLEDALRSALVNEYDGVAVKFSRKIRLLDQCSECGRYCVPGVKVFSKIGYYDQSDAICLECVQKISNLRQQFKTKMEVSVA